MFMFAVDGPVMARHIARKCLEEKVTGVIGDSDDRQKISEVLGVYKKGRPSANGSIAFVGGSALLAYSGAPQSSPRLRATTPREIRSATMDRLVCGMPAGSSDRICQ